MSVLKRMNSLAILISVVGVACSLPASKILTESVNEINSTLDVVANNISDDLVDDFDLVPEELGSHFEGDMIISDEVDNGLIDSNKWWPNGVVPYEIVGKFSSKDLLQIHNAMREYHKSTCIRFRPKRWFDKNFVSIQNKNPGCYSHVGRIGGKQLVNFQTPGCLGTIGTPIHELMHTLGFFHEQSRSDRDNHIIIQWQNIQSGKEHNFNKYDPNTISAFGVKYDYSSVMHYGATAFSKNTLPTIKARVPGVQLGQRNGLSSGDIQKVKAMYKCR